MFFQPEKYEFPEDVNVAWGAWFCKEGFSEASEKIYLTFVYCFTVFTKSLSHVVSHFLLASELLPERVVTSVLHLRKLKIKEGMWHAGHWAETWQRQDSRWVFWLHSQCFLDRPYWVTHQCLSKCNGKIFLFWSTYYMWFVKFTNIRKQKNCSVLRIGVKERLLLVTKAKCFLHAQLNHIRNSCTKKAALYPPLLGSGLEPGTWGPRQGWWSWKYPGEPQRIIPWSVRKWSVGLTVQFIHLPLF